MRFDALDLRCKIQHYFGTGLRVDGTEYQIDRAGMMRGVSDVDARTLLVMRGFDIAPPEGFDKPVPPFPREEEE